MEKIRGVLNLSQVSMADQYLIFDDEKKYKLCKDIIAQALKNMNVKATKDERLLVMDAILDNTICLYESQEHYEECILLQDLKEVLHQQLPVQSIKSI